MNLSTSPIPVEPSFSNKHLDSLRLLADTYNFKQLKDSSILNRSLSNLQNEHGTAFVDLGLLSQKGIQLYYAGPYALEMIDYSNEQWFRETMKRGYFVSDVIFGFRRLPHFNIAVKLNREKKDWIFRSTIDFTTLNYMLENIRSGETGMDYIMNRHGVPQTKPPVILLQERKLCLQFITDKLKAVKKTTVFESKIFGKQCLFIVTSFKNKNWFLIFQQDVKEAFTVLY